MPKTMIIEESIYTIDAFYIAGAKAYRSGISYHFNPHRMGSTRFDQWNYGHAHEAEGLHSKESLP